MNFLSRKIGMQVNFTAVIPSFNFRDIMEGRENVYVPGMKYQVLYLLHGGSGDDQDYVKFSNIVRYAEDNKLAVIMPADYNMMYLDHPGPNGVKYFSYIVDELRTLCCSYFPISDKREDNFIGGLSMGTAGTLRAAFTHPELFSAALVMSGGFGPNKGLEENRRQRAGRGAIGASLPAGLTPEEIDLTIPARKAIESGNPVPKIFMTWGDEDSLAVDGSRGGVPLLREMGYDVFAEEVPGYKHEWDFWDLSLRKALYEWLPLKRAAIYPEEV